ncbi:MAG: NAD-dependent epimerase/dehydratase family protein [Thermodesulfobacteriota bacterium]
MDLLTGATGFLGSRLAARLARDGRELRAIVRPGTDLRRIPREISEVVWGEVTDPDTVARAMAGVEVVYHTAARVSGSGDRSAFARDNVEAVATLLKAADAAGVERFVHVSSIGIFGASQNGAIAESTPLDPEIEQRGHYAWSKAEADRLVRGFRPHSRMTTVVVRPGILYGADAPPFIARLQFPVPRGKGRRVVVGRRDALLPLAHVDNVCDAIVLAAAKGQPGTAYNVVDDPARQGEYLELLAASGAASVRPTFVPPAVLWPVALACEVAGKLVRRKLPLSRYKLRRATESLRYDTSAARDGLGWTPAIGLEEGVRGMSGRSSAAG